MNARIMVCVFLCFAEGAAGCAEPVKPAPAEGVRPSPAEGMVRTTTMVLNGDPKQTVVHEETVTRAALDALVQARLNRDAAPAPASADGLGVAQDAITANTANCANLNALWVYDNTTGSDQDTSEGCGPFGCTNSDLLCLVGSGTAYFGSYTWESNYFGSTSWQGQIRAFWPGCSWGYFHNRSGGGTGGSPTEEEFRAIGYQGFTIADTFVQNSTDVTLESNCM